MNPLADRLNNALEHVRWSKQPHPAQDEPPTHPSIPDQEIRDLTALAQRLAASSRLRADPDFARRLEQKLLAHHTARYQQRAITPERSPRGSRVPRRMRSIRVAVGLALLLFTVGVGLLVSAVQASDPTSPLYPLHNLLHLSSQTQDGAAAQMKAAQDVQHVQQRLAALEAVTDPAQHEGAYQQALVNLEQDIQAANAALAGLPQEYERAHLAGALSALTTQARHLLRTLLLQLTLAERQTTTAVLGTLGERIPIIQEAVVAMSAPPTDTATITLTGSGFEPGAMLLIDGRVFAGSGTLTSDADVFVVAWTGDMHPHNVGILNPDDTVTQTTAIQVTVVSGAMHGKENGGSGKGNGKAPGKPGSTPTPPGSTHQ